MGLLNSMEAQISSYLKMGHMSIFLSTNLLVNFTIVVALHRQMRLDFLSSYIWNFGGFAGSGLVSQNKYNYGFFSAAIKLPPGYTSGVVVAFYVSSFISF